MTVYTNPGHAYLVVAGLRLDTSLRDPDPPGPSTGPRWSRSSAARPRTCRGTPATTSRGPSRRPLAPGLGQVALARPQRGSSACGGKSRTATRPRVTRGQGAVAAVGRQPDGAAHGGR